MEAVRALLDLSEQRERTCADVDALAARHLVEVTRKIADLTALPRQLSSAILTCDGGAISECRILEAFAAAD